MGSYNFSLRDGVKHSLLGFGNVVNQNPNDLGLIEIYFENGTNSLVDPNELEYQPTDSNDRIIKVDDLILYPVKGGFPKYIQQGKVSYIKKGKSSRGYDCWRIGILEDKSGQVKSHAFPNQCIVIDRPILK